MNKKRRFIFESKFVTVYPTTAHKVNAAEIKKALERNARCDWGDIGNAEWLLNDEAYKAGHQTVAMYLGHDKIPLVVVSEPKTSTIQIFPDSSYGREAQRAC